MFREIQRTERENLMFNVVAAFSALFWLENYARIMITNRIFIALTLSLVGLTNEIFDTRPSDLLFKQLPPDLANLL